MEKKYNTFFKNKLLLLLFFKNVPVTYKEVKC